MKKKITKKVYERLVAESIKLKEIYKVIDDYCYKNNPRKETIDKLVDIIYKTNEH